MVNKRVVSYLDRLLEFEEYLAQRGFVTEIDLIHKEIHLYDTSTRTRHTERFKSFTDLFIYTDAVREQIGNYHAGKYDRSKTDR